jgi:hypothetical protein
LPCALLSQLYVAFLAILKTRRQRNQFKGVFFASVGVVGLLLLCTLGSSIAAAVLMKETYSTGNMLATAKGEVIRVAPASYALELIAAPVMTEDRHASYICACMWMRAVS